jgi:hypothetical protein
MWTWSQRIAVVLCLISIANARILGVFQGQVIRAPYQHKKGKWLTVQSRNGFVRQVEISKAAIHYDDDFPVADRRNSPEQSLIETAEVLITAERQKSQNGDGDWQATEILILNPKSPGIDRSASLLPAGNDSRSVVR